MQLKLLVFPHISAYLRWELRTSSTREMRGMSLRSGVWLVKDATTLGRWSDEVLRTIEKRQGDKILGRPMWRDSDKSDQRVGRKHEGMWKEKYHQCHQCSTLIASSFCEESAEEIPFHSQEFGGSLVAFLDFIPSRNLGDCSVLFHRLVASDEALYGKSWFRCVGGASLASYLSPMRSRH